MLGVLFFSSLLQCLLISMVLSLRFLCFHKFLTSMISSSRFPCFHYLLVSVESSSRSFLASSQGHFYDFSFIATNPSPPATVLSPRTSYYDRFLFSSVWSPILTRLVDLHRHYPLNITRNITSPSAPPPAHHHQQLNPLIITNHRVTNPRNSQSEGRVCGFLSAGALLRHDLSVGSSS